jgi:hypothetical protein
MTLRDKAFLVATLMAAPHTSQQAASIIILGMMIVGAACSFWETK